MQLPTLEFCQGSGFTFRKVPKHPLQSQIMTLTFWMEHKDRLIVENVAAEMICLAYK